MKATVQAKANTFKGINEIALKGEIVIYGSTYLANFPFYELANKCHLEHAIYNRSIDDLTTEEAEELLQSCVLDIAPKKIFLQLGEENPNAEDVFSHYQTILKTIRMGLPDAKTYLLGLPADLPGADAFHRKLKTLCDGKHVIFVPFIGEQKAQPAAYTAQFKQLVRFFRDNPISLSDAFTMAEI